MALKRSTSLKTKTRNGRKQVVQVPQTKLQELQERLDEAEAILDAIRGGQVEALVVNSPAGDQVFTLKGADHTYRVFIEAMSEGAVTLGEGGVILYSNKRFAEMIKTPLEEVIGSFFQQYLAKENHAGFMAFLREARAGTRKQEFALRCRDGTRLPVNLSISPFEGEGMQTSCLVVGDLSVQKHNEERLLSLSHRLLEVQERERRHLARELHDEVGQILTGLKITLETNSYLLPAGPGQEAFQKAREQVEQLVQRIQDMSLDLRPAMLDDLGLLAALLWHFERYTGQTGVKVDFRHAGLGGKRFSPELETAAYRIVQEALTNVARHSGKQQLDVYIHSGLKALVIQIEDAGRGFDVEQALSSRSSSGLTGMQERAALMGGELLLHATPGRGTQVRARLPYIAKPLP